MNSSSAKYIHCKTLMTHFWPRAKLWSVCCRCIPQCDWFAKDLCWLFSQNEGKICKSKSVSVQKSKLEHGYNQREQRGREHLGNQSVSGVDLALTGLILLSYSDPFRREHTPHWALWREINKKEVASCQNVHFHSDKAWNHFLLHPARSQNSWGGYDRNTDPGAGAHGAELNDEM